MVQPLDRDQLFLAVVVPSLKGDVDGLLQALQRQTWQPDCIQVVRNVRPNGRARNQGVSYAFNGEKHRNAGSEEEVIVFIDDDAVPAQPDLLEKLTTTLLADESVGVTGTARVLPAGASWFQRRIAGEIPRMVNPVPAQPLETNPPVDGYGHSLITTTCCAVRRRTYQENGGFSEELVSGVDTDFFYRIRKRGLRFLMVPDVFVIHPVPSNLKDFLRKFYWYGVGYAQEAYHRPQQHIGPRLPTGIHRYAFLLLASLWLVPNTFILYSFSYPKFSLGFRPIKALSTYAVAWGYASGWRQKRL